MFSSHPPADTDWDSLALGARNGDPASRLALFQALNAYLKNWVRITGGWPAPVPNREGWHEAMVHVGLADGCDVAGLWGAEMAALPEDRRDERLLRLAVEADLPDAWYEVWEEQVRDTPKAEREAALRQAAAAGHARALLTCARMGGGGACAFGDPEALLRRAAATGAAAACRTLGLWLLLVRHLPDEAEGWLRKGFNGSDPIVAYQLALCAERRGDGAAAADFLRVCLRAVEHVSFGDPGGGFPPEHYMPVVAGRRVPFALGLGWPVPREAIANGYRFSHVPKAHFVWLAERGLAPQEYTEADLDCYAREVLEHLRATYPAQA